MESLEAIKVWAWLGIGVGGILLLGRLSLVVLNAVRAKVDYHRAMRPKNWYIVG